MDVPALSLQAEIEKLVPSLKALTSLLFGLDMNRRLTVFHQLVNPRGGLDVLAQATLLEVCDLLKLLPVTDHKICLEKIAYARLITDGSGFNRFFSVLKDDASREFVLETLKDSWATIASSTKDLMLILTLLSHEQQAVVLQGVDWEKFRVEKDKAKFLCFWKLLSFHKAIQDSFFEKMKQTVCETRSVVFLCDALSCMTQEQASVIWSFLLEQKIMNQMMTSSTDFSYFNGFLKNRFPALKEKWLSELASALSENKMSRPLYAALVSEEKLPPVSSLSETQTNQAFLSEDQFSAFYADCALSFMKGDMSAWMEKFLEKAQALNESQRQIIFSVLNKKGDNALVAITLDHPRLLAALLNEITTKEKYDWLRIQCEDGWTALMVAAKFNPECMSQLLTDLTAQQKYDLIRKSDSLGSTALLVAARYHPECVVHLLADLEPEQKYNLLLPKNKSGWTPLSIAAAYHPEILMTMLEGLTSDQKMDFLATDDRSNPLVVLATHNPTYLSKILEGLDEKHRVKSCIIIFVSSPLVDLGSSPLIVREYRLIGRFFLDMLFTQSLLAGLSAYSQVKLIDQLAGFKWLLRLGYRENKETYLPKIRENLANENSLFSRVVRCHRDPFGIPVCGETRTSRYFKREMK
jgi:hypothetical protein